MADPRLQEALLAKQQEIANKNMWSNVGSALIQGTPQYTGADPVKAGALQAAQILLGGALGSYGQGQAKKQFLTEYIPQMHQTLSQPTNLAVADLLADDGDNTAIIQALLGGQADQAKLAGEERLAAIKAVADAQTPQARDMLMKIIDPTGSRGLRDIGTREQSIVQVGRRGGPGRFNPAMREQQLLGQGASPQVASAAVGAELKHNLEGQTKLRADIAQDLNLANELQAYIERAEPLIEAVGETGSPWPIEGLETFGMGAVAGLPGVGGLTADKYNARKAMDTLRADAIQAAKAKTGTLGAINAKELEVLLTAGIGTGNTPQANRAIVDSIKKRIVALREKGSFINQGLQRGLSPDAIQSGWATREQAKAQRPPRPPGAPSHTEWSETRQEWAYYDRLTNEIVPVRGER
jgi:hypothetical protein